MAQSLMVHVHIVHLVCAGRKVISKRYANANSKDLRCITVPVLLGQSFESGNR